VSRPRDTRNTHDREALSERNVRVVRAGHGANCSSIGSVVDTLFATAALGSAVFAAVLAALKREDITVVGDRAPAPGPPSESSPPEAA
jgi:hypothetical protein